MKNLLKISILFFVVAVLFGCTARKPDYTSLHRQWMLVEFKDYSKEFLAKNKANLDLSATKSPENQYNAFMGCNRLFMTAEFKQAGQVEFSKIGSTMMYCAENMNLEYEFAKYLPAMTHYTIQGHILSLTDGHGNRMKFIAADWD